MDEDDSAFDSDEEGSESEEDDGPAVLTGKEYPACVSECRANYTEDGGVRADFSGEHGHDCDGGVDDPGDLAEARLTGIGCGNAEGLCTQGIQICVNGALQCAGSEEAQLQVCDGWDNDCDGVADNGLTNAPAVAGDGKCLTEGVCAAGAFFATTGTGGPGMFFIRTDTSSCHRVLHSNASSPQFAAFS